ncbi:cytidine deaminase [uncultured Pseudokineococcus sp.]|uniref:cytidine deaminase family protein n=1 Tax=uncultured Pseudokineococcus sp. TaxID=1642928 RepID=UPI0026359B16|nr:cytidine deaminase [uncultured Pseudokineococcus sp.]
MEEIDRTQLVASAAMALRPLRVGDRLFGDVAATLVTDQGDHFTGVCIDTGSGTGFCAEASAIAAMVTAGQYRIAAIAAVWRDDQGRLYVLPPCGRCREFINQMDPANATAEIVLSGGRTTTLQDLLPARDWPQPEPEPAPLQ